MGEVDKSTFFVLGLGKSGVAVSRLLVRKGLAVVAYDDDDARREDFHSQSELDGFEGAIQVAGRGDVREQLLRCGTLVVSPGVPLDHSLVSLAGENEVEISGELEVAYSFCTSNILGVTGTNGKSTVVSMLGEILKKAGRRCVVAGNIGVPFSEVVEKEEGFDTVVLEISSFQLDTIKDFKADVAVLLNVTEDHLDRYHDSMDEYAASKSRILNRADEETSFVYNDDDQICKRVAAGSPGGKIPFSANAVLEGGVYVRQGVIVRDRSGREEEIMPLREFSPVGIHNLENALAAAAAATSYDVDARAIGESLKAYRSLPHRMELTRVVGGVAYVNDSKATNVDAAIKSIRSMEAAVVLIMGGLDKNNDFRPIADYLERVEQVILIGDAADKIETAIADRCEVRRAGSMEDAVAKASEKANAGDTVLLAPACASFDMFDDYVQRGNAFREAVNNL